MDEVLKAWALLPLDFKESFQWSSVRVKRWHPSTDSWPKLSPALAPQGLGRFLWSCCQGNPRLLCGFVVLLHLSSLSPHLLKRTLEKQLQGAHLPMIEGDAGTSRPQTERTTFPKHLEAEAYSQLSSKAFQGAWNKEVVSKCWMNWPIMERGVLK